MAVLLFVLLFVSSTVAENDMRLCERHRENAYVKCQILGSSDSWFKIKIFSNRLFNFISGNLADASPVNSTYWLKPKILKLQGTIVYLKNYRLPESPLLNIDDSFINIIKLTFTSVEGNINKQHFLGIEHSLRHLIIHKNKIQQVNDQFQNLRLLEYLDLSNNQIQHIDVDAFEGTTALLKIDLKNNELKSFPSGLFGFLRNLKYLDLSANRISSMLDEWRYLQNLQTLNLTDNQITDITDDDLQFQQSITLDLRNNQIKYINLTFGLKLPPIHTLLLEGNPIQCDCHLYDLLKYLGNKINDNGNLKCHGPSAFNNTLVTDVIINNFTCSIDGCPSQCSCVNVPANSSLELKCLSQPDTKIISSLYLLGLSRIRIVLIINKTISNLNDVPEFLHELILSNISLNRLPTGNYTVGLVDLSHNDISSADGLFNINNITSYKLSGNPFICDCDHESDIATIQENYMRIKDYSELKCGNEFISKYDKRRLCSTKNALVLGICITTFVILIALLNILYYRYQREIKLLMYYYGWWPSSAEEALDRDKQYDAFVSFAHEDTDFVMNILLPVLESEPNNFKLCIHTRDWIPGQLIQDQIYRSVEESRRTILVLSKSFIESTWSLLEFGAALKNASTEKRAKIIAIVLDDVTEDTKIDKNLKAFITTNTYVKWGDPWFWEKLVYALPKRHNVNRKQTKRRRTGEEARGEFTRCERSVR